MQPTLKQQQKQIRLDEAIIIIRDDGIISIEYKENTEINVELQDKLYVIFRKICSDGERPFLFKAMDHCQVTPEAKINAIKKEDIFPGSATAVVAQSLAYKLIANFYVKVKRPKKPFRVFNDEDAAVEWLLGFRI